MELLVNIDVDDLPRAIAFYVAAFALRVGRRFGDDGVELLGSSSKLYLLRKPPGASDTQALPRDYRRHWTPVHLDFVVDDDWDAALERARTAGARLERQSAHDWGRMANFADPFGHGFCLLQFSSAGYDAIATAGD